LIDLSHLHIKVEEDFCSFILKLESEIEFVEKRTKIFESTDVPDLKDEEVKEILHDVLTELYYSKGKKAIQRS
jgi:hypothetical protein